MAQTDNILGAPTEGLGQRVTFAFSQGGGVPQLGMENVAGGRSGVVGGASGGTHTQGQGVAQPSGNYPVLDTIMKLSGGIAAAQLRKKQQEAFFTGMQRAAQGEAITNIADEQPWYSKLFGDSDAVEGARAYTAETKAQTVVASMEQDMPNLRMLSAEDANKYFLDKINAAQTGDTATDMAVMQSFTRAMPSLMKRQAKEHYGWQQGEAVKAQSAAFSAGADNLQARARGLASGTVTEDEYAADELNFMLGSRPPVGMDPEKFIAGRTADLITAARKGNFHALNAYERAGWLDAMTPEQQAKYESARNAGETAARGKYGMVMAEDMAKIKAISEQPTLDDISTADLKQRIDAVNKGWQAQMGTKSSYYISPEQTASLLAGHTVAVARQADANLKAQERAAAKLATVQGKDAANQALDLTLTTLYEQGNLFGVRGTGITDERKSEIQAIAFNGEPDPVKRATLVVRNFESAGKVSSILQGQLRGAVSAAISAGTGGTGVNDKVQKVFADYNVMRGMNAFAADAAYGDLAPKMESFRNMVSVGYPIEGAFNEVFVQPDRKAHVDKKSWTAAGDAITSEFNGFFSRTFGATKAFMPGMLDRIITDNSKSAEHWAGYMGGKFKDAAVRSVSQQIASGKAEIIGGAYFRNMENQGSVSRWLVHDASTPDGKPIAANDVQSIFRNALDAVTYKAAGYKPSDAENVSMFRIADKNGKPQFHVYTTRDGETKDFLFTGDDILSATKVHTLGPSPELQSEMARVMREPKL